MRVFITGPLGYIGKPVAEAFRCAGHQVRGLVRSEEKANILLRNEIEPIIGDLSRPDTYNHAIEQAEVIVHCALDTSASATDVEATFVNTLMEHRYPDGCSSKAVIYTSGVWVVGNTGAYISDESSPISPIELVYWRKAVEERILDAATRQFRPVVIRPGCVYGAAGSLTSLWFSSSLRGSIEIAGEGNNHWAMVHQQDLAQAYLLAAEKELCGVLLNVVDNSHFTVLEMATAASEAAGIPGKVTATAVDDATQKYGKMIEGLLIDQHISNERATRLLGWHPRQRNFVDGAYKYYMAWKATQSQLY